MGHFHSRCVGRHCSKWFYHWRICSSYKTAFTFLRIQKANSPFEANWPRFMIVYSVLVDTGRHCMCVCFRRHIGIFYAHRKTVIVWSLCREWWHNMWMYAFPNSTYNSRVHVTINHSDFFRHYLSLARSVCVCLCVYLCDYSHTVQPRTFKFWHNIPHVNI